MSFDSLADRVVLITGGSSGIGLALAHKVAEQGAHVWLLARRPELLEQARAELRNHGGKADFIVADVSDPGQVHAAADQILQQSGAPDLLVNCAGAAGPGYADEMPVETFHAMMDINYFGTVHVVKALLPEILKRGSGHIVNFSSVSGFVTGPGFGAYSPSKYAVRAFTDVLRAELKPKGIGVSLVFPPDTDTPQLAYEKGHMTAELRHLADNASVGPIRFGVLSAEQVAEATLQGVRRGKYSILPGGANKLLYRLVGLLGDLVFAMVDDQWTEARRKYGKPQGRA